MNYDNIPKYIRDNGKFCLWRYEERNGKSTKVPYQVNGSKAKANNHSTSTTFETAMKSAAKFDGIELGIFGGISAIDIDHCIDEDGSLSELAQSIVTIFDGCYIEKSPSGKGLRILFLATDFSYDKSRYYIHHPHLGLEVYVSGATLKYVTLTGDVVNQGDMSDATKKLQLLLDTYIVKQEQPVSNSVTMKPCSYLSDNEVITKSMNSTNGEKFTNLWNAKIPVDKSNSDADIALAMHLAFGCGKDLEQMDRLFRRSRLFRDKWDRQQSGSTYGRLTLEKAIGKVTKIYQPIFHIEDEFSVVEETTLEELKPFSNSRYSCTDIGNSNLFADYYKNIARYVPERKQWFIYDGKAWHSDTGNLKVMKLCKKLEKLF